MNINLILGLILLAISIIILIISCFDRIIEFEQGLIIGVIILFFSIPFIGEGFEIENKESESNLIQQIIIKK
jgi:hypothetical protein